MANTSKNEFFKEIALYFKPDKKSLNDISDSLEKTLEEAFKDSPIGKIIASGFMSGMKGENVLKSTFDTALKEFSSIVRNSLDELDDMLQFSQMSSSQTRDLAFGYGLTGSQAYGYTRAMTAVGLESEEDLMYMNVQEQRQFREAFTKYTQKYEELYDQGFFEKFQEYQFEMEDFKFEMQQEVIEFFMNNKDTLIDVMTFTIKTGEFIVDALGWIVDFFGESRRISSDRSATTSDIISSHSVSNRTTTVKIDNTFNNVSKSDQSWLAHAGSMTYEQVIRALEGG